MKYNYSIMAFFVIIFQYGFSQIPANYNADNESFGMQPMLQYAFQQVRNNIGNDINPNNIKGSPYLNRNFNLGAIYSSDGLEGKALMRYDAYNDEVQLKSSESDTTNLILHKKEDIYCVLTGKEMYFKKFYNRKNELRQGYLFKIAETDDLLLFERRIKRYKEGKEPANSFELPVANRFVGDRELYYQHKKEDAAKFIKPTKKNVVMLFDDEEKAAKIKAFLSKNRLNLQEPKSVAQVFYYYNTL